MAEEQFQYQPQAIWIIIFKNSSVEKSSFWLSLSVMFNIFIIFNLNIFHPLPKICCWRARERYNDEKKNQTVASNQKENMFYALHKNKNYRDSATVVGERRM